jgi:hypothetical protein
MVSDELDTMWKERSWPDLKVLSQHLDGLRKTTKSFRIAGLQAKILSPGPPEYEAGMLTTRPKRSMPITQIVECFV